MGNTDSSGDMLDTNVNSDQVGFLQWIFMGMPNKEEFDTLHSTSDFNETQSNNIFDIKNYNNNSKDWSEIYPPKSGSHSTKSQRPIGMVERLVGISQNNKEDIEKETTQDTIRKLDNTILIFERKIDHIGAMILNLNTKIQSHMKVKNTTAALGFLKKKKMLEMSIKRLEGNINNLNTCKFNIESIHDNKQVYDVMGMATMAMRSMTGDENIESASEMVQEMNDQMEISKEMSEVLSRDMFPSLGLDMDDDSLLAELNNYSCSSSDINSIESPLYNIESLPVDSLQILDNLKVPSDPIIIGGDIKQQSLLLSSPPRNKVMLASSPTNIEPTPLTNLKSTLSNHQNNQSASASALSEYDFFG